MPTSEELIAQMKSAGADQPVVNANSGGSGGIFLEVLKAREGKWLVSDDFKQALKALGVEDKYISNKLYNLKKKAGVETSKSGRTSSYRFTTAKFDADVKATTKNQSE